MASALCLTLAPVSAVLAQGTVELTIQPSLCVLSESEGVCRDQVTINWRAGQDRSLCLYASSEVEPLDCWQQSRSGTYVSNLETGIDVQFQLLDSRDRRLVASRTFEVIADAKRYRRRRRNPWSFF